MIDSNWFLRESRLVAELQSNLKMALVANKEEEVHLAAALLAQEHSIQAQAVLGKLAQQVQQRVHQRISTVVSSCLAAVFDDPYEFQIVFEQKRGGTVAQLQFIRDGHALDPTEASGGGAVDIAAFALRAVCLVLHRPRLSRVLFLDEPFKFVSREYQLAVKSMLEQLSVDLKLQIVMVTHNEAYEAGKIVEL
jgi:DNA repair exonuclease SbcCD ATPase subunit